MNRTPTKKCSICKRSMSAVLIHADHSARVIRIFRKTLAVLVCATCDRSADPESYEVHRQLASESGTM